VTCCPTGPINVDDRRCTLPREAARLHEIESLINHFKLIMDGPQVPAGEVYVAHEGANGELGFYLVSDGGGTPYKVHVPRAELRAHGRRAPLLEGYQLADIVPTFGSINMIGGECDR
jgi:NADH-quinone oxidoreductase subunit D